MKKERKEAVHVTAKESVNFSTEHLAQIAEFSKNTGSKIIMQPRNGRMDIFVDLFREENLSEGIRVPKCKKAKIIPRRFSEGNTKLFLIIGKRTDNEMSEMHSLPKVQEVGIVPTLKAWSVMSPEPRNMSQIAKGADRLMESIYKQSKQADLYESGNMVKDRELMTHGKTGSR